MKTIGTMVASASCLLATLALATSFSLGQTRSQALLVRDKGDRSLAIADPGTLCKFNNVWLAGLTCYPGSATGGLQDAINAAAASGQSGAQVWVPQNIQSSTSVNMAVGVDVYGVGKVSVDFTGGGDGFVWPNNAYGANLYRVSVSCRNNSGCGKAINISDASSAAHNVTIEDILITGFNLPSNAWNYGIYESNALLNRFTRIQIAAATTAIHTDGVCYSNDFTDINTTETILSHASYLDIQGGQLTFIGGEIEGAASTALVNITQPGAAQTLVDFHGTIFENATSTAAGIIANTGAFECYGCLISIDGATGPTGFIIGNTYTSRYSKFIGGQTAGWTLGANADHNKIEGARTTVTPSDSSGGVNDVYDNVLTGSATYASETRGATPNFSNSLNIPTGQVVEFGGNNQNAIFLNSGSLNFRVGNNNCAAVDSSGRFAQSCNVDTFLNGPLSFNGSKGQHFKTQAATNDLAGTCTASASTTCTVTFTTAYTSAPSCTATDQTNITTVKVTPSTTTLVITTVASSSDVFAYHCIGNPN